MENLDLFTPVEEGLPTVTDCNYYCRYSSGLYRSGYFGHQGRFSEGQHPGEVTHWLDLSKLTTKERAIELVTTVVWNHKGDHTNDIEESIMRRYIAENAEQIL